MVNSCGFTTVTLLSLDPRHRGKHRNFSLINALIIRPVAGVWASRTDSSG